MNVSTAFPLDNAGWPAMLVNPDGVVLRTNPASVDVFGTAAHEGRNIGKLWTEKNPPLAEVLANGKFQTVELRIQGGKKSSNFLISILPQPSADEQNYLLQFFPQETAGNEKAQENRASEPGTAAGNGAIDATVAHRQKLDCALQLARSVSLDFNNALTSILGHTSLLITKSDPQHPWRNSLVEIEKSAERAAEIASDLANFSRQEKEATAQKAGNLNELLRQVVDAFRGPENLRVKFQLELERKMFAAKFDEAKLQQAFVKIIENAVQALTGEGTVTVRSRNCTMELPLEEKTLRLAPGTYICVEVVDSGPGIAPEALPRIFEPFFTTKGQNHRGLGLTWVYGIVTNHGGGVAVSSQPGQGTTVQVYLPATKRIVRESSDNPDEMCGVETILVVDDEDLLLNMSQMVLSSFGYRALTANNGLQALEILEQEIVDLVITDLVMPNMSGRELIERIRMISPDVKIVCSSGYARPKNQPEEYYLEKPFTAQDLLRKVRQALTLEQPA